MVSLVYGFIHVAHSGWGNTETFVVFTLAIVLLVGFVLYEAFGTRRADDADADLREPQRAAAPTW